jgi:sterol desaturase/sphingolipid hydroxylase (fatty acid hydroxylase superfamily)
LFNTVTHHDAHHTNTQVNFGVFFNVWDRWMGTFSEGGSERPRAGRLAG